MSDKDKLSLAACKLGRKGEREHLKLLMRSVQLCICWVQDSSGKMQSGRLTVDGDADLRVVVFVRNLPDIERFGGRVGQQAEEQDDGVGWRETLGVDLSVGVKK